MMLFHPELLVIGQTDDGSDDILQCPDCGYMGLDNDFDCMGADDGCVFCNGCCGEFKLPPWTWPEPKKKRKRSPKPSGE